MSDDNSDYKLPRTQLHKLLPDPYDSDANAAVFENLFNRFLSKTETRRVAGYIGEGNPTALVSRQIQEPTLTRQANQLQPVMYSKVGSEEHMKSWGDVLLELERLGVDISRLPEWGAVKVFNWVPPIDLDKVVNFRDYFWVDDTPPEYITIRNRCTTLEARTSFFQRVVDANGDRFPLVGVDVAPVGSPATYNAVLVSGDYRDLFEPGFVFRIVNSTNVELNNIDHTVVSSSYNAIANHTTIVIDTFFATPNASGAASIREVLQDLVSERDAQCGPNPPVTPTVGAATQWIERNKWTHRTNVINFTTAQQAEVPILEFDPDLELNEWTNTEHKWLYRASASQEFVSTTIKPRLIELKPFDFATANNNRVIINQKFGDQTSTFVPDSVFDTDTGEMFQVVSSVFRRPTANLPHRTEVTVVSLPTSGSTVQPTSTSQGAPWIGYDQHWVYQGRSTSTARSHPVINPFITEPETGSVNTAGFYTSTHTPYAQTYIVTGSNTTQFRLSDSAQPGWTESLRRRAIKGADDVRVYVDGIRMFGNYVEQSDSEFGAGADQRFTSAINFDSPIPQGSVVRIEVGEAAFDEIGMANVVVRTTTDDDLYDTSPSAATDRVSLVSCRKVEQVKTETNQYPRYDVFNLDGTSALTANHLFGYQLGIDAPVNIYVNKRIVADDQQVNFSFEQHLLTEDGGMLAYRNYSNNKAQYWVDDSNIVHFWTGFGWSEKGFQGDFYSPAATADTAPTGFQGRIWYDTFTDTLKEFDAGQWVEITDVIVGEGEPTLQTIWREGLNDEHYVPQKVDWKNRTLAEYNAEREEFISQFTTVADGQAAWIEKQRNPLSPTGVWIGDWELPDPLYFNNQHDNRKVLDSSELLSHTNSIKAAQPKQPGIPGATAGRWHSLPYEEINFGLGGKIHEYNGNFDTLLSSVFVNNVTPPTLFEFARDQYEILLNSLREILRNSLFDLMSDPTPDNIVRFTEIATASALRVFNQNDNFNTLYGDSLTFVDNTDGPDVGQRNWIATLPFLQLAATVKPELLKDDTLGLNEVVHHDGHRRNYGLAPATIDGVVRRVIGVTDPRSTLSAPLNGMGQQHGTPPPLTAGDFVSQYGEPIDNRHGVFWYHVAPSERIPYRLVLAGAGTTQPSATLPDGSLWYDTAADKLKVKNGLVWSVVKLENGTDVPDGVLHNGSSPTSSDDATINAWQVFDINLYLAELVLQVEKNLVQTAPTEHKPVFDFGALTTTMPGKARVAAAQEQQFLDFVRQSEVETPYRNLTYSVKDPFTWNYKRSAPGQRYNIVSTDSITNTVTLEGLVAGNFTNTLQPLFIKNSAQNNGTFTFSSVVESNGTTVLTVNEPIFDALSGILYVGLLPSNENTGGESAADWRGLYQQFYGTPYPHLEPWKLQGYTDKPSWWDAEYKEESPARRWKYDHLSMTGMWMQLSLGIVPSGKTLPDGVTVSTGAPGEVRQYNYFSVDLRNDELFAPYVDHTAAPYNEPSNSMSRSIFRNIGEINSPAADYAYGDQGPIEMDWRLSSQFAYDQLTVAYTIEPLKFIGQTYGFDTRSVGGLDIDKRTNQVPAHNRTIFHGEVLDNGTVFRVAGLNQLYVNYNRYQGFDANLSDFRRLWTTWSAPLTYQFSAFIDTASFQLGHRTVPISEFDYRITAKKSAGVEDYWVHGLDVTILSVPPRLVSYNNQSEWVFQVDINSPLTQSIDYYDVQKYQFLADPATDICSLYTYEIKGVNFFNETFAVTGNQTLVFQPGQTVEVFDSTANDGTYTVSTSVYDATADQTLITVTTAIGGPTVDGKLRAPLHRTIPWETGDSIWVTSDRTLPAPLVAEQRSVGLIQYFIIKVSPTEFKVANTQQAALQGIPIELSSVGVGNSYVSQLHTTFRAFDGRGVPNVWRHHKLDLTTKRSATPPLIIRGMQSLIDFVDGYAASLEESGVLENPRKDLTDPLTGRPIGWQIELERFIDGTYALQDRRDVNIGNRFQATVDATTNTWTWTEQTPQLVTGDPVSIMTSTGESPSPILPAVRYYIIVDSPTTFRMANTRLEAKRGQALDMTSEATNSILTVYKAQEARVNFPTQEINPFRNGVFFSPPRGIVSNMTTGPSEDIRNTQLLFDQYGRPLDRTHTRIFRQDTQTYIQVADQVPNNVEPSFVFDDPYNFIHLGGAHIFIDAYEHVLIFNEQTTEGVLLYDPFVGLNVTKFELLFQRQAEQTERPNVGGSYYTTFFNQGAEFRDNFEAAVENIRYMYDVSRSVEAKPLTIEARRALGYEGTRSYLTDMNLNEKSQFMFWRGLIQNKGSRQSIEAFINSRRFIDAKVDEFWAYKVSEFGSAAEQEFLEMYVTTDDIRNNDFRILFTETADAVPGFGLGGFSPAGVGYDVIDVTEPFAIQDGVTPVSIGDTDRWFNQPDVLKQLEDQGDSLYFDLKVTNTLDLTGTSDVEVDHGFASDFEVVTLDTGAQKFTLTATAGQTEVTLTDPYLPGSGQITVFKNGYELTTDDYQQLAPVQPLLFSSRIRMFDPLKAGEVITVVYGPATLQTGVHFDHITSNVIRFRSQDLVNPAFDSINLWGYRVDADAQNPAKLIDRASDTVVAPVQLWDPARGLHYQKPLTIIDIEADADPALYTNSVNTAENTFDLNSTPWNHTDVGTVWFDTSRLGYVPYYDYKVFPQPGDRLDLWGRLADWADIVLYEWVESDVPPSEYNELAEQQAGNAEIPEHLQKSGRVRETLFERNANNEWVILDDKHQVFKAAEGTPSGAGTAFVLDNNQLGLGNPLVDVDYVSIYVNGILRPSPTGFGFVVPPSREMVVSNVIPTDEVRFIKFKPYETDILAGIEQGIYRRDVEHTQRVYVDQFGQTKTRYYFWVRDKATRNLTQEISPRDAATQLITIPVPYIITSDERVAEVRTDELVDVDRSWSYILTPADQIPSGFSAQILGQTEKDFATFDGGSTLPTLAYAPGYRITMANGVIVRVDEVDAVGDVTRFTILQEVQSQNTTTGSLGQQPTNAVTDSSGNPVGSEGFILTNGPNNVNDTTHQIGLGSPIKNGGKTASLIQGSTQALFVGSFEPGTQQSAAVASYNAGDVITLTNGALVQVNSVDGNGDVATFTITDAGDPFVPGTPLEQVLVNPTNPAAPNSGFTLLTSSSNTDVTIDDSLIKVYVNGRQLDSTTEFTVNATGRFITIRETAGAVAGATVGVEYVTSAPRRKFELPNRHTSITIRGLRRYITEDNRFTIRFTRDFTLRDKLSVGETPLSLKQNHQQWTLIREEQPGKIDRALWDRVTEAIAGYKLSDNTILVPSLNRRLYDTQYGTDTQYGLGDGQAFTNGAAAVPTIRGVLFDLTNPPEIIDLDVFFATRDFDTPANAVITMNDLYEQLTAVDVNRVFFAVLHDAFTFKREYAELFKTSMIAVHGIRPFQVAGLFDD